MRAIEFQFCLFQNLLIAQKMSFSEDTFVLELDRWLCIVLRHVCGGGCGVRNGACQARNVTAQSSWLICGLRGWQVILEWTVGWVKGRGAAVVRLNMTDNDWEDPPLHTWHLH